MLTRVSADDASTISANSQQRHEDLGHVEPDAAYVPYAVQPGTTTTARVEYYSIQLERGPRGFGFSKSLLWTMKINRELFSTSVLQAFEEVKSLAVCRYSSYE